MERSPDSLYVVVEEEKHGTSVSIQAVLFLGGAIPFRDSRACASTKRTVGRRFGNMESDNTRLFRDFFLGTYPQERRLFRMFLMKCSSTS